MNECQAQAALVSKGSNITRFHTRIVVVCALMLFLSLGLYSQGPQTVLLRNRGSCKTRVSVLVLMFSSITSEAKPSNSGHTYYAHILLTQAKNFLSCYIYINFRLARVALYFKKEITKMYSTSYIIFTVFNFWNCVTLTAQHTRSPGLLFNTAPLLSN